MTNPQGLNTFPKIEFLIKGAVFLAVENTTLDNALEVAMKSGFRALADHSIRILCPDDDSLDKPDPIKEK